MGERYVNTDDFIERMYFDSNKLYEQSMSQSFPYDEKKFEKNVKLEDLLNTWEVSDRG